MINIDKVSNSNKNYKYKIFLSFFIFSIVVLASIIVVHLEFSKENSIKKFQTESHLQSEGKRIFLNSFLEEKKDSIIAIRDNPYFREFAANGIYPHNTDFLFFTMMQENKEYMQMRFLDTNGREQLRFDRDQYGHTAYKVANLQNKSNRYYFTKTISLKNNNIFFSKIDFNMEEGKIQKPYIPVLRIATPVYIHNKLKGILIINIFIDKFMQLLTSSPIYNISVFDDKGYIIKNNHQYYDKTLSIDKLFDNKTVSNILKTKDHISLYEKNVFIQKEHLGNQKVFILYKSKTEMLNSIRESDIKMTAIILIFTIFLSIPFALLLARPIKDMFEIVIKQSDKLHEIATTLDKKVEEETLKNAKKDRLLQHQSKMAELGDMIGNIAHQWRHPLTRLSLILQNLKLYKSKDKLTDKIFFDSLIKSNEQIDFMSNTIDDFKDFYKPNKEKVSFKIQESFTDILKIIGTVLEHENIKITIKNNDDIEIFGIKNQLSQVLLNLIINAKDALVENNISNPTIDIHILKLNDNINITIHDNANGIPANIIKDIFNPYFTTKEDKGTGIGLYLSKTIIEDEMNGK
ncbi:MAG: HAMP domain-containing sensor histidine kinase, partial [Campylobacterota bacterium]|nr:HAMP domain-containing sensor histidine kinase [Campylobacterota bacterium]